ncbi:M56 family metallopeptidase [Flavobacterium ardleyense]|uniref:M56 family metallopeptidase n=1 Tax=Flavobacterium ardleyense TaxID=2038737 RepID=A0ABW5Z7X5_9FLAO
MINFLFESTVSLIGFLAFYHLFLEGEKMHRFNRFYLLISLVVSFIIPLLNFEIIEIIPVQNTKTQFVQEFPISNQSIQVAEVESVNYLPTLLWSLYGIITSFLLIRFGKNVAQLYHKSKSNPVVKYKKAKLVLVDENTLPHSFLNFIYVNLDDYENHNIEDELYTHELVHITQKHTLDILFIEILKCLFWFNPIVYFYKKAIQLNHEFLADEKVVNSYNNVTFYQNLLLQKSSNIQTIYLASNLNYLVTKKRLIMMTKSTSKKLALAKKIAIVPILAGLVYFFSVEIVAQEKITSVESVNKKDTVTKKEKLVLEKTHKRKVEYLTYKVSDEEYYKDVVCVYYQNVEGNDMTKWPAKNIVFSKKYQELSKDEIEKLIFLKFRQEPTVKKSPTQKEINDFQNSKKYAIWIDGIYVDNSKLNNYKPSEIVSFGGSVVLKNARTKKHPQPFQFWFYTNKHYKDKNMDKWQSRFPSDSLIMSGSKKK